MKKESSTFVPRGLTDVFDFNELVNDLWLAFPKAKDRKPLEKFVAVIHARMCNQKDPNCFVCQCRWLHEMHGIQEAIDAEQEVSVSGSDLPAGIAVNGIINEHMRQKHYGLPLSCTPQDLWYFFESYPSEDVQDCMFLLVQRMDERIAQLPPEKSTEFLASGWQPMFEALRDGWWYEEVDDSSAQ